jgi:CBS domain containing-hemolysin-like protein
MEIEIAVTCLLLVVMAFIATVEVAFGQLSDLSLRRLRTEVEDKPTNVGLFLTEISEDRPRFRFTLSTTIQILLIAISVLFTSIFIRLSVNHFIAAAFIAGVVIIFLFRQLIPRLISLRNPERTVLALLPIFRRLYQLLAIVAVPWHRFFERVQSGGEIKTEVGANDGDEDGDSDDLQALIDVGAEEGILEEDEGELIHSIIEFGDTTVNEVMTPRTEIVALPVTATVREARDLIVESKYSRLPVYREQIDNVEGLIYVRDLLQVWSDTGESEGIASILRPTYFVTETKHVSELLSEMQKARVQLAMVIDEYGGVAGLVTVEDILEEIVGEIEDEDTESDEIIEIIEGADGYYEMPGSTEIGKIERLFDMEIEDDDFTTIAGLVISESGRVPRAGEHLNFHGLDVEVLDADERRINQLRLRRAPEEAQAE